MPVMEKCIAIITTVTVTMESVCYTLHAEQFRKTFAFIKIQFTRNIVYVLLLSCSGVK